MKNTTKFNFPFSTYKQKGTYSSYIHMNYAGDPLKEFMRENLKFYDVNVFVTAWISSLLLEINRFNSSIVGIDLEHQLINAIDAIVDYQDKNMPSGTSLFVFWPQSYNTTTETWTCSPTNLEGILQSDERIAAYVHKILDDLGMGSLWNKIAPYIHSM